MRENIASTLGEHVVFVDEFEHKFHNIDNPDTLRTTWENRVTVRAPWTKPREPGKLIPPC